MFESPDEQDYSPGGQAYGGTGGELNYRTGPSAIKKFIPIIILAVIIIAVAFLVLSYLGSQIDVTINLVDSEKKPVQGKIILKDSSQKIITLDPKGTASQFTAKLTEGTYYITANATGYKTSNDEIDVTKEKSNFNIEINKDLKASLTIEFEETQLFEGQTLSGKLSVLNNGTEFKTTDIISSSDAPLEVKILYPASQSITTGSSMYLDFNVTTKAGTPLTAIKPANLAFKIRGSEVASQKISISVLPAVAAKDITITASLSNTSLTAGNEIAVQISIRNGSKITPLKNLTAKVTPDLDSEDKIDWFRFIDASEEGNHIKIIENIDPTKTEKITLYVKPLLTAKKGDYFKGTLEISSISINGQKTPLQMNYVIGTEKNAMIELKGIDSPFTINCSEETGICETKNLDNGQVYLVNSGNVDVGPIQITISPSAPTTPNCSQFVTNFSTLETEGESDTVTKLSANPNDLDHKATIMLDFSAPVSQTAQTAKCAIQWRYIDPLSDPPTTITNTKILTINSAIR